MALNRDQAFLEEINWHRGDDPLQIRSCPVAEEYAISLIDLDRDAGRVRVRAELGERWLNGGGVIQGGIVAGILDFAMAFAVLAKLGSNQALATTNLDVSYLRPCLPGVFEAEAVVVSLGRSVAFLSAEMFRGDGNCVATGTSNGLVLLE